MSGWFAYAIHAIAAACALWILNVRRHRPAAGRPNHAAGPPQPVAGPTRWWEIALGIATACALLALTSGPILIDLRKAYLYAGHAALSQPSAMYDCIRAQCFVNIPIVALLFVPLTPLTTRIAGLIFSLAGAWLLLAAVRRMAHGARDHAIVWLVVLSGPIYYSIRIGNTTHMLLLPLIIAFDCVAASRQPRAAGAILAGLALLKPPLALFLPYFILRRNLRTAMTMSVCAAGVVALSVVIFGIDLHWFWFLKFVVNQGSRPIGAYNVQSVNGFLAHLFTRGHMRDWYPIDVGVPFRAASAALSAALVAAVAIGCWRAGPPRDEAARRMELWLVLCLTVVVAPISWTHYDLLLLLPGAALVSRWDALDRRSRTALAIALALLAPPVVVLDVQSRLGNALYERVLISHYFAGSIVLLGLLIAERLKIANRTAAPPMPPHVALEPVADA